MGLQRSDGASRKYQKKLHTDFFSEEILNEYVAGPSM
jgi:hypothetical protein